MTDTIIHARTRRQREAIKRGDASSVSAGQVDRGLEIAPFEAISFNRRTGEYLRTRHFTEAKAMMRLNAHHKHGQRHMVDHNKRYDAQKRELPLRVIHLED
jgi:hypothetical protein